MDDTNKKRIIGITIIITGLILLALIIYFLFFYNFSQPVPEGEKAENVPASIKTEPISPEKKKAIFNASEQPKITKEEIAEEELKRMAASFTERFGSYSNQSSYGNILDLKIFMTAKMQDWADNFIKETIAKNAYSGIYYGVTTKAVSETIRKFDDDGGEAIILVSAQRREATGATNNITTSYQDILIKFTKEKGAWKVDSADWQKK
jgi:hypothetical protein